NIYHERFIYFELSEVNSLLIGPFLIEPIREGEVSNIIRAENLPIKRKSSLMEHYRKLEVLGENHYFYLGKLLDGIFGQGFSSWRAPPAHEMPESLPKDFFVETYENRINMFHHPPYFLEQEIARLITAGDKTNAMVILSQINTLHRAVLAKDPVRSLRNSLICSCTFFTRAAIAGGATPDEAFTLSDTYIMEIEATQSLMALDELERRMVIGFTDLVRSINEMRYSKLIRQVVEYINNHLTEKITLEELAGTVFVHPNYLSSLFKRETGNSVSQYILLRRIEESKYFIRYSSNTLSDIASFYQFCSQSHFTRIFKQYTGITPYQFRNQQA
ncbi:AraC family transcriptional regulator, partial [Hydrogenoanaerobacterium sp.]|uniref:AraC family transcriptional regulator n=1 Tax=Hydrogenoanaerobacterium sp. TaxID=2953763 RepID=UPI00289D9697